MIMRNRIFSILLLTLSLTTTPQLVFAQNTVQQLFKQGETAETVGDNSQAETIWRKVLQVEPNNGKAYNNLGNALRRQGKLPEALTAHQKALQLNPNDAEAYVGIGNVLNAQGKPDEAVAAYRKAIEFDPKYAKAYNSLGNVLSDQKKLDEAVAAYRKAIEFDPKYAAAYNNLGNALYDQKKLDKAVAAYKEALLSPNDTSRSPTTAHTLANNGLGLVLQEQEKLTEALKHFEKAEELDPDYIYAHNNSKEANRLWTEKDNNLASVDDDRQWLPKNDPNLAVKRSVVRIIGKFSTMQRQGTEFGTGVVIQRDANRTLILTCRHVIFDGNKQGKNIQVEFFSSPPIGKVRMRRNAKLFKTTSSEDELDLAVLEITDKLPADIQPLSMSTTINPAMSIQIIGHDAKRREDKSWSVKSGKISYQKQQLKISEAKLAHGYSGSPVIDSKNRIIGIVYARKKDKPISFAYPISEVKKQLSIWKITLTKQ